jgi:hypothetical protein
MAKYLLLALVLIFYLIFSIASRGTILSHNSLSTNLNVYLPFLIIIVAIFIIYLVFSRRKNIRLLNHNLGIIAQLLNTQVKRPFLGLWFYQKIEGFYKDKEVICKIFLVDRPGSAAFWAWLLQDQQYADIYIKLNKRIAPNKITESNVYLARKCLHYKGDFRYLILWKEYSKEEIITILDKLVNAVKAIELS